jgi:hypothetical protein
MANGNNKTAKGSALDFEAQLWAAADKMRGHTDTDSFGADLHPDLKADFILSNPLLYRLCDKIVTGIIQTIPLYGA